MPKVVRTARNRYGLTIKQSLVIKDIVTNIKNGQPMSIADSHMRFYNVKKRSTAAVMANENLNRPNFKRALYSMLEYEGVLGVSGKLEGVLSQGLDAYRFTKNGDTVPDFGTRLKYVKEINKIVGIY